MRIWSRKKEEGKPWGPCQALLVPTEKSGNLRCKVAPTVIHMLVGSWVSTHLYCSCFQLATWVGAPCFFATTKTKWRRATYSPLGDGLFRHCTRRHSSFFCSRTALVFVGGLLGVADSCWGSVWNPGPVFHSVTSTSPSSEGRSSRPYNETKRERGGEKGQCIFCPCCLCAEALFSTCSPLLSWFHLFGYDGGFVWMYNRDPYYI